MLLCASAAVAEDPGPNPWKKTNETEDGIVIFYRMSQTDGIREFKAFFTVEAKPIDVWNALMDKDTYKESRKYLQVYKVFKTDNENVWYNYQLFAAPLLDKRDYTLRYECFKDRVNMHYHLVWSIANDHGPNPENGVIRLTMCGGSVIMEPRENGNKTLITYWICFDPGGLVPAWATNIATKRSVPDFLRAVRDNSYMYRDKKKKGLRGL
jgi:hypothetical protein